MDLTQQKCVACEGGIPPMPKEEAEKNIKKLHQDWQLFEKYIERKFEFKDFKESMAFINKVAGIAEEQGHHPDMYIFYNKVTIKLTTHAINGLFLNDFIVAAHVDKIKIK